MALDAQHSLVADRGLLVGTGEEATTAFTDFGVDNLIELVRIYKADPDLLRRYPPRE
jgi:hypothetical protein